MNIRYSWHRSYMITVLSYECIGPRSTAPPQQSEAGREGHKDPGHQQPPQSTEPGKPTTGTTTYSPREPQEPERPKSPSAPNPPAEAIPQTAKHMPQRPWPNAPGVKTWPQVGAAASSGERQYPPNQEQHKQDSQVPDPGPVTANPHSHINQIRKNK